MQFGFEWPSGFREDHNGHIGVFSPWAGADNPLGYIFFPKHNYLVNLVLCYKFSSLNDFATVFPIQTYRRLNLTFP